MRSLLFLVAVSCCSAHLLLPHSAHYVLPGAKLITKPYGEAEVKPVALSTPYRHHPFGHHLTTPYIHPLKTETKLQPVPVSTPYFHSYAHHLTTPYLHPVKTETEVKPVPLSTHHLLHPLGYHHLSGPYGFIPSHHIPYVAAAEEETVPAQEEEATRRRRDVSVPLPYLQVVPITKEVTVETKQFEATDAATPADTTQIELTTKEHEISIPAVKYVQPHVNYKPVTYTAVSPAVLPHHAYPYHAGVSPAVLPHHAYPYPAGVSPVVLSHHAYPYHAGVSPVVLSHHAYPYHAGVSPAVYPHHSALPRFPYHAAVHGYYPALAPAPVVDV